MIAAHLIQHDHVKRRRGCALLVVSSHVEASGLGAMMDQLMDDAGIAMECEDDWLIVREDGRELLVVEAMRMVPIRL